MRHRRAQSQGYAASHERGGSSPSFHSVAEEALGAYKDVSEVVDAADDAHLPQKVVRLEPVVCIKG